MVLLFTKGLAQKPMVRMNANGIIKKKNCLTNKKPEPACDLYVKEAAPQPPPPAMWPPLWPLPVTFHNGSTEIAVSPALRFTDKSATPTASDTLCWAARWSGSHSLLFFPSLPLGTPSRAPRRRSPMPRTGRPQTSPRGHATLPKLCVGTDSISG